MSLAKRRGAIGVSLLVPAAIMLVVFIIYPLYAGINLSLTDRYLLKPDSGKFIGLENYITFVHSHEFAFYLRNTFNWTFWSVFGAVILGTFLAVQLNKPLGAVRPFYRSLVLIPWIMPITATSIIWRWIYDGQWGILNYVLTRLHLINVYIPFLGQKLFIWPSLVVFFVWKVYPFVYVMVLSALQTVPTELNDSAVVDGASKIKIFWRINFPILVPTLVIVTLLLAVWTFNEFAAIWLMTQAGPGEMSMTLSPLVYQITFLFYRVGFGASIGVFMVVIALPFAVLYVWRVRREGLF